MHAQEAGAAKPGLAFDVTTVKPVDPNKVTRVELRVYPGGRLVVHGYLLRWLIAMAFDLPEWEVVGGEKWVDQAQFDIEGKPPEELRYAVPGGEFSNARLQDPEVRSMLQTLLIDRFHLQFHMESRPGTVYLLKRGKGPLRLTHVDLNLYTRSEDGTVAPSSPYATGNIGLVGGVPVSLYQTSMLELARVLGGFQQIPVRDETGLPGFYNFKSQTAVTDEDFKNGPPVHLLVDAVPEMGLKLEKTKGVVEKLVIDNVEPPTAN